MWPSGSAHSAGAACRVAIRCRPRTRWGPPTSTWGERRRTDCALAQGGRQATRQDGRTGLRERHGLTVIARGARAGAASRGPRGRPDLRRVVRTDPRQSRREPRRTGWRVGAVRHWLWAFATPETTVYRICHGRGFDEAAEVLGADFDGVLVRGRVTRHRRCTSALRRVWRTWCAERAALSADHPRSPWAARVQAVLTDSP